MSTSKRNKEQIHTDQPATNPINPNRTSGAADASNRQEFDPSRTTALRADNSNKPPKQKGSSGKPTQEEQMERNPFLREGGGDGLTNASSQHPDVAPKFAEVYRDLDVPERGGDDQEQIEEAAIWRLDVMAFGSELLKLQSIGRAALRNLIVALFLRMVSSQSKAEVRSTLKQLRPSPMRDYTYGPLPSLEQSAIYDGLHATLHGETPVIWRHANLELFQRIRALRAANGEPLFKDAGKYLVVDGSSIEAQAPQKKRMTPEQRARLAVRMPKAKLNGHAKRIVYKLVVISCATTNLPLVWSLEEGTATESEITIKLLRRLFNAIPDLPSEYLVGDKHYDTHEFCRQLVYEWGLQPVCRRSIIPGKDHEYTQRCVEAPGVDGVPMCACGDLMVYIGAEGFKTGAHRVAELKAAADEGREPAAWAKRGNPAPPKTARLNFRCANDLCSPKSTWVHKAPHIYTYLPRAGTHHRRLLRIALYNKRNLSESIFSALKASQIGAENYMRARWADDMEVEHLVGARLAYHTARHFIHLNGDYERILNEVTDLDILSTYRDAMPKAHDEVKQHRLFKLHREAIAQRAQPRTWHRSKHEGGYNKHIVEQRRADSVAAA